MQEIKLKLDRAYETDLELISNLAEQIWKVHYTPIIGEGQVNYMLQKMYGRQSLLEQIKQKNHIFFLIKVDDTCLGFISVNLEHNDNWFLNKFYILTDKAGSGLGTMALEELKKIIQPKKMTLTVNRQNFKSINFYFKNNFKINHVADFDIGDGYVMNDFVMVWQAVVSIE